MKKLKYLSVALRQVRIQISFLTNFLYMESYLFSPPSAPQKYNQKKHTESSARFVSNISLFVSLCFISRYFLLIRERLKRKCRKYRPFVAVIQRNRRRPKDRAKALKRHRFVRIHIEITFPVVPRSEQHRRQQGYKQISFGESW